MYKCVQKAICFNNSATFIKVIYSHSTTPHRALSRSGAPKFLSRLCADEMYAPILAPSRDDVKIVSILCTVGTDLFARSNVQRAVGVLRVGEEAVVVGLRGGAEAIMRHGEVEDEVAGASGILQVVDELNVAAFLPFLFAGRALVP